MDHISLLSSALNASSLRQQTISQNIANAETPDYKAKKVIFEDILQQKINTQSDFTGKRTNALHLEIGQTKGNVPSGVIVEETGTVMQNNGNNVDMDSEMTQMSNNSLWYYSMVQQMNSEFQKLSIAIKGRV